MLEQELTSVEYDGDKQAYLAKLRTLVVAAGYDIVEEFGDKPWGGMFRLRSDQAPTFIAEFFPGLSVEEATRGVVGAELSPKFLIVMPGQRLSWQYHFRRAERWNFLTSGAYRRSETDEEGERVETDPGEVVQFETGERHRLEGMSSEVVIVAEIWQHTDPKNHSDEDDIVRVSDDYRR